MKEIMNREQVTKVLKRITHEIIERNLILENIVIVGILQKGYPLALILQENLKQFANIEVATFPIDISSYRDDLKRNIHKTPFPNNIAIDIAKKTVIIVDDVLYTGRTVRACMDALIDYGRPDKIQLAVLVDRGHRELPIRADYIGKNLPTSKDEKIIVDCDILSIHIENIP